MYKYNHIFTNKGYILQFFLTGGTRSRAPIPVSPGSAPRLSELLQLYCILLRFRISFQTYGSPSYDLWIGADQLAQGGVFRWTTGKPLSYTNWGSSHPRGVGTCVYWRSYYQSWEAGSCSGLKRAVCQIASPTGKCKQLDQFIFPCI